MKTHEEVKKALLTDPDVRAEYYRLESELQRRQAAIRKSHQLSERGKPEAINGGSQS